MRKLNSKEKANMCYARRRFQTWRKSKGLLNKASTVDMAKALVQHGEVADPMKVIGKGTARKLLLEWNEANKQIPCQIKKSKNNKKPSRKKTKKDFSQTGDFLKSWEWRSCRYDVLLKHGRRCMCCGATPDDGVTVICVDHIKPRHTHPELALNPDNLQILCNVCNMGKGARDTTDFRDNVIEYDFQCRLANAAKEHQ